MEAKNSEYFIDGFLIRHFGIFPVGFEKDNMFQEQKIFFLYLMGIVPGLDDWSRNVSYQTKLEEIKNIQTVAIDDAEFDIATLRNQNIDDLKKQKLIDHKKKCILELKKEYGIKIEDERQPGEEPIIKTDGKPQQLWELLQGKGLI
jgi:hypothetical protein